MNQLRFIDASVVLCTVFAHGLDRKRRFLCSLCVRPPILRDMSLTVAAYIGSCETSAYRDFLSPLGRTEQCDAGQYSNLISVGGKAGSGAESNPAAYGRGLGTVMDVGLQSPLSTLALAQRALAVSLHEAHTQFHAILLRPARFCHVGTMPELLVAVNPSSVLFNELALERRVCAAVDSHDTAGDSAIGRVKGIQDSSATRGPVMEEGAALDRASDAHKRTGAHGGGASSPSSSSPVPDRAAQEML
jgi:hypothetical protein